MGNSLCCTKDLCQDHSHFSTHPARNGIIYSLNDYSQTAVLKLRRKNLQATNIYAIESPKESLVTSTKHKNDVAIPS